MGKLGEIPQDLDFRPRGHLVFFFIVFLFCVFFKTVILLYNIRQCGKEGDPRRSFNTSRRLGLGL